MTAGALASPRAFAVWFRDFHRWSVGSFVQTDWGWPAEIIKPLSVVLSRKVVDVARASGQPGALRLVTLHFDGEMELRDASAGDTFKGRLFHADPGDVIYSKIDVRNGAIGIIPDDLGRVCVSSEYPVYTVNPKLAEARFVKLLFRTAAFRRKINSMISGASGRKRVQPTDLVEVQVPLPPLAVQWKIVAAWEASRKAAAATAAKIAQLEADIEARFLADLGLKAPAQATLPKCFAVWWKDLLRWSVSFNALATTAIDISGGKYGAATLGEVAAVSYGIQKCPTNRPGLHPRPYLRVANVQRGELDLREIKYLEVSDAELPTYRLEAGDILFVEGNGSKAELGRCALWHGEIADCVHQNHILKVRPDQLKMLPDYAMTWFNTDTGKDHFFRSAKTSSGLGTINSTELRAAPIPIPPLNIQRQIVERVAKRRAEIAKLKADAKARADSAKADVEAMILGTQSV
jgi:type I restriction enzyme S subunit